jgi:hypothetical protein
MAAPLNPAVYLALEPKFNLVWVCQKGYLLVAGQRISTHQLSDLVSMFVCYW